MSEPAYNGISDGEEEVECDILADENPDLETNNGGEVRKNLFDDFKELGTEISSTNEREYMKAFLRIRPFTEEEKGSEENQNCMEIEGDSAILLNAPKDSFTAKNEKRGREVTHRFTFSRVFAPETTQKEFFDDTSLGLVKDFVDGQNCLIFTYGVTNSGKTYTIQGTPSDGGVLPRTLDVLFNSVEGKEYSRNNLKPRYFCDVSRLDEKQEHMEIALRNGLIMSLNKEHFDLNSFLELENSELSKLAECEDSGLHVTSDHVMDNSNGDNDSRTADNTTISVDTQGDIRFSVWVSFAEIYNEQIYDLLEQCPDGQGKKRTTLKLGDDKHGNPYVKGLREVCVSNADEAYKILRVGKKNQRIASTKLNHSSSRSHCIFTIKVLRVMNVDNPHVARVSRLSFVDLAGSERYSKTQSTGDRLKEAGNINTSLMTLGKCLDYLRYNQSHINKPQCIPFRESKLTRLFQGFFCGKGKASMVVNINQCASTFDETYHALKFSAIAKQVSTRVIKPVDIVQPLPEKSFRASFAFNALSRSVRKSIMWENGGYDTPAGGKCFAEEGEEEEEEEEEEGTSESTYQQQLVQLVKVLQEQLITEKKEKASMELKIRDEVCSEMQEQLVDIENAYSERYQEDINAIEKKCDRRIELLTQSVKKSRKRPRVDRVTEDEEDLLRDEKKKNKNVTSKLEEAKQMIDQLNKEKKELEQMLDEAGETFAEKDAIIERQTEELELLKAAASDDEKRCSAQDEALTELRTCLQTASKEVEIARIKLDQRDRQMMEKAKEIEELKRILREHEELVSQQQDALEKGSQELKEKVALLSEKETEVSGKQQKIEKLEKDLEENQASLEDKCNMLERQENVAKKLELALKETQENVVKKLELELKDTKENVVKKLELELTETQASVEEKSNQESLVKKLTKDLKESEASVDRKVGIIDNGRHLVEQLREDLTRKTEAFEKEEAIVQTLQAQLLEKEAVIQERNSVIHNDEDKIKLLERNIEEHQTALNANESFVGQLNTQVKQLRADLEDAQCKLEEPVFLDEPVELVERERHQGGSEDDCKGVEIELASTVSKLRAELLAKDEMMKELVSSLEETRELLKTANSDVVELKKEVEFQDAKIESQSARSKELEEMKVNFEKMSQKLAESDKQLGVMKAEMESHVANTAECEELKCTIEAANKTIRELQAQILSAELKQETDSSMEKDVVELRAVLEKANKTVSSLEEVLASKESRLEELLTEVDKMKKDLDTQRQAIEDSRSEETSVTNELENKLKSAEKKLTNLEVTVVDKERELVKSLAALQKAEEDLQTLSQQQEKERAEDESRSKEISVTNELENKLKTAEEKLTSLEVTVVDKERELVKSLAALKKAEEDLQTLSQQKENERAEDESRSKAAECEIEKLKKALSDKESALEKTQTTLKEAETKLKGKETLPKEKVTKEKKDIVNKTPVAKTAKVSREERLRKRSRKEDDSVEKDDAEIAKELEKQLEASTRALDKKNTQLISRNNTIRRIELSVIEKNNKIDELEKERDRLKSSSLPGTPGKDPRMREEVRTLRRRNVQAEKEVEELKEKVQETEKKLKDAYKEVKEREEEKDAAETKAVSFEQRITELQSERDEAKKEADEGNDKDKLLEKKIEELALESSESKKTLAENETIICGLKKEIQELKNQYLEKTSEYEQVKEEVSRHEKLLEEAKQKQKCIEKESEEKLVALRGELEEAVRRAESAEVSAFSTTEENMKKEEDSEHETSELKGQLEKRSNELLTKETEMKVMREKFSKSEQEKSDELDKVWRTMEEMQAVIKERGETIDALEIKLKDEEAKHNRQRSTLEQTLSKMKDVMDSKGNGRNQLNARITELEAQLKEKTSSNEVLLAASETREKEVDALKDALQQQDQVMEEQNDGLNERQLEIESLTNEIQALKERLGNNESSTAEMRRLEGTLSVYVEDKAKLEKELAELRRCGEGLEISKVEISRDCEKEKSDILVKLKQKEGMITKLKTQHKGAETTAAREKRMMLQQLKEKEWEVKKLNENLEKVERKKQEYEELVQLKESDVRKATEEKDGMLKAMREAFAVATNKKTEFEEKLVTVRAECEKELKLEHDQEIARIKEVYEAKLSGNDDATVRDVAGKREEKRHVEVKKHMETKKVSSDTDGPEMKCAQVEKESDKNETAVPPVENNERPSDAKEPPRTAPKTRPPKLAKTRRATKRNDQREDDSCDSTISVDSKASNDSVKDVPEAEASRIEIDVTPVMGRRRAVRATTASKTSTRKRRSSSELTLAEIKAQMSQMSATKQRKIDFSDDEFTPGSVARTKGRTRSAAKKTSSVSRPSRPSSAVKGKPSSLVTPVRQSKPLSPMNENGGSGASTAGNASSVKKKAHRGIFGKLFDAVGGENSPPHTSTGKKKRKLLKKDISGPMDTFSPVISKESFRDPASQIITRQLRTRTAKK